MVGFEENDLLFYQSVSMDSFHTEPKIGQKLSLKVFDGNVSQQVSFAIMGILDFSQISDQDIQKTEILLLPVETMQKLVNCSTVYEYQIQVSDELEAQAEMELRQILHGKIGIQADTLSASLSEAQNFLIGLRTVLMTAIALLGCFVVLNLSNTILTGIIARRKEFVLLR